MARALQLLAALPSAAGLLPLADVNFLVTTDVHSFLASHHHPDHDPLLDADFGSLASFVQHARTLADKAGKDLFVFDNGDSVDGTGLSSSTAVHGAAVFPLLAQMPYDALNCGNHELYQDATVLEGLLGPGSLGGGAAADSYIGHWNGSYLTSNIDLARTGEPLGSRFVVLEGKHGARVLVLGFLYDMPDHCGAVNVTHVAEAVRRPWFAKALATEADAIVVLAHMHYTDPLTSVLLRAIRSVRPATPVQFLTGHSHIRAWTRLDARATSFEAGHYADTCGFAAFNLSASSAAVPFEHVQVEMNRAALAAAAGVPLASFDTPAGLQISKAIAAARARLGVSTVLGCSAAHFAIDAPLNMSTSIWRLYMEEVAPAALLHPPKAAAQWFVTSTGALRYDLFAGGVTVDDVGIRAPHTECPGLQARPRALCAAADHAVWPRSCGRWTWCFPSTTHCGWCRASRAACSRRPSTPSTTERRPWRRQRPRRPRRPRRAWEARAGRLAAARASGRARGRCVPTLRCCRPTWRRSCEPTRRRCSTPL